MSENKVQFRNYFIPKLIRLMTAYISINIATNYMSQIYTENVLINNTDPPSLTNLVIIFIMIDILINAIIFALLWFAKTPLGLDDNVFKIYLVEYIIIIFAILIQLYFISTIMYSKKYFLYKDDGLKGIRALRSIFYIFIILYYLMPFGWLIQNTEFYKNIEL